jgi:hypothetical protein
MLRTVLMVKRSETPPPSWRSDGVRAAKGEANAVIPSRWLVVSIPPLTERHRNLPSRQLDDSHLPSDLPADGGGLSSPQTLSPSYDDVDVTTYVGAPLVRIEFPQPDRPQVGGGRRRAVRGLSPGSRREMLNFLNSINMERVGAPPLVVTLTYPDRFPTDNKAWTEHFNRRFRGRLKRRFPGAAVIWRKEFEQRKSGVNAGKFAPHFHLLLFVEADPSELYEWLSRAWYESCGRICDEHLLSGTRVEAVLSREGAKRYLAKRQDEVEQLERSVPSTGRCWGRWNEDSLPIEERHHQLSYDQGVTLRGVLGELTGVNPPVWHREPTNMAYYVKHSTTQELLDRVRTGTESGSDKAGARGTRGSDARAKGRNGRKGRIP